MDSLSLWLAPNTLWVLTGCILLGASCGSLGCFAFLRGRSLLGDALAHAALPGVCLAYLISGVKSTSLFLVGAIIAGLVASYCITTLTQYSRIKEDSALAIVLSVFFGFGIVLLTSIQHSGRGNQSGLDKFLFGQAASMVASDVVAMMVLSALLLLITTLLFKELKLLVFDSHFGRGLGYPMGKLDGLLMLMLLVCVVAGLQAVGVVLVAAMLIAPAVSARYWTEKLGTMVVLAGFFGALSGVLGTFLSTQTENMPTGPVIVLAATAIFLFSLFFSPHRGILPRLLRFLKLRRTVLHDDILQALYELLERDREKLSPPQLRGYSAAQLAAKAGKRLSSVRRALSALKRRGLLASTVDGAAQHGFSATTWTFTPAGLKAAHAVVLNRRLWDVYHMNEQRYHAMTIDPNQPELAAQLAPAVLDEMMRQLESYDLLPKLTERELSSVLYSPEQRGLFS